MLLTIGCPETERDVKHKSSTITSRAVTSWRVRTFTVPVDLTHRFTHEYRCPWCKSLVIIEVIPAAKPTKAERRERLTSLVIAVVAELFVGGFAVAVSTLIEVKDPSTRVICTSMLLLVFVIILISTLLDTIRDLKQMPYRVSLPGPGLGTPGWRDGAVALPNGHGVMYNSDARTGRQHYLIEPGGSRSTRKYWHKLPEQQDRPPLGQ